MKRKLQIRCLAEKSFSLKLQRKNFERTRVGGDANNHPQSNGRTHRMVLVILPDGKVVRRPEPLNTSAPGKLEVRGLKFEVRTSTSRHPTANLQSQTSNLAYRSQASPLYTRMNWPQLRPCR